MHCQQRCQGRATKHETVAKHPPSNMTTMARRAATKHSPCSKNTRVQSIHRPTQQQRQSLYCRRSMTTKHPPGEVTRQHNIRWRKHHGKASAKSHNPPFATIRGWSNMAAKHPPRPVQPKRHNARGNRCRHRG
jgi:hypothetical protein